MAELPSLEETVVQFGLRTKKSLGQHFLLDAYLCEQIVGLAGDLSGVHVIEIGPGPGGLTRALLTSDAAHVTAIEKDARALPVLAELQKHSEGRLSVLEADAMQTACSDIGDAPRAIIANLPYNIATELLFDWLNELHANPKAYQQLLLMFQREVGERMAAQPGSKAYGKLAVMAQWLCDVELRMDIPRAAFSPPPKVESVMVQLVPLEKPRYDADKKSLEKVVHLAFQQRRKMLRTALKSLPIDLADLGIDETLRADQVSIAQYAQMANALGQ